MIRRAYLAGQWYPGDETSCRNAIITHGESQAVVSGAWRATIVPHAGWVYSGNAMGAGYRALAESHSRAELVIVFGSHRGPQGPNTLFRGEGWDTPLGLAKTDQEVAAELFSELSFMPEPEAPKRPDNAVEVQMPFIRHFFPHAKTIMMGVAASKEAIGIGKSVGEICKNLGRDTVFVGSTDLTHYGPNYGYMPQGIGEKAVQWVRNENDRGFLQALEASQFGTAIEHSQEYIG